MRALLATLVVALILAAVGLYASAFIVHQYEQALVLRLGEPRKVVTKPGLNWKVPFIETVDFFEKRILDLDSSEQEVTTIDQKRVIVDAFTRFRVVDALEFYKNVREERRVRLVLGPVVESTIRSVLGAATLQDLIKDRREALMRDIATVVNREGRDYGIEVVDVRIKKADLPPQNLESVFNRMKADRVREAVEIRAQGEAEANRIRANAERQTTVILAEAKRKAEQIRGEGDAEKTRITGDAFGKDAEEFYAFYRAMQAYEQSIRPGETRMLLSPDSEFFRYFNNPSGAAAPKR
jgi:membrane protease subunit HflC